MASPISFGDAYLMGKLASRLGNAFTKGRKSAPAEFREVENHLYSLSAALCALDGVHVKVGASICVDSSRLRAPSRLGQVDNNDTVGTMLRSCGETLQHLEHIVEKYSCIGKPRESNDQPKLKRWSRDLKDNWKKIAWTTEGGDLATLRSQLTVHTNSLNLVLGVAINSQTNQLEIRVEQVSTMLKEIHEWFVHNLKTATSTTQTLVTRTEGQGPLFSHLTFELYAESDNGPVLVCNKAGLHSKWNNKHSAGAAKDTTAIVHLFVCHCSENQSHNTRVGEYGLSLITFPVRLIGKERTWMLYKVIDKTCKRLVSLFVKHVSLRAEFEETFIRRLAVVRSSEMLRQNMNTMLAYHSLAGHEGRILHLIGDINMIDKYADTVTFSSGRRSYTRGSIEAIKLLHYQSFDDDNLRSDHLLLSTAPSYLDTAEVVVFYDQEDAQVKNGDVRSTVVHLKHNTPPNRDLDEATVLLPGVKCTGLCADEKTDNVGSIDVTFKFNTSQAAERFYEKLEEMRMELFIMRRQFPQKDEATVLKLQASQVHTEEIYISDAEISIIQNKTTQRLRLIVVARNGCSILSQELAENFLSSLTSPTGRPNFASTTYLIEIEGTGTRQVRHYPSGFEYLSFSDVQADRLFEIGLATIAGTLPLPTIEPRASE